MLLMAKYWLIMTFTILLYFVSSYVLVTNLLNNVILLLQVDHLT